MKKVFALVLCLAILLGALPVGEVFRASAAAEKSNAALKITGSKYVAKGKKVTLEANQPVTWKTSDKKIATVTSAGVVKGVKAGKVTITAVSKANTKIKKTWKMTVTPKPVSSVKITGKTSVLSLDGTKTVALKAVASPSSAAQSFTWKSNHKDIAKVNSKGIVTAVKPGIAKITATATDGSKKKATFTVTVKETYVFWSSGGSTFSKLADRFLEEHPEYAYVEIRTESNHSVSDIIGDYQEAAAKPDLFIFAQDQLAMLVSMKALATVSTSGFASDCAKGTLAAVKTGGKAYGYPLTADNGFFLFYNKNVISDPGTLESILEACESAGKQFHMELTSGWYNASFFYGAGCKMDFAVGKDGYFTGVSTDVGGSKGVKALKAMAFLASSPAYVNNSSASNADENTAAIVSGVWDAYTLSQLWGDGYAAARLPTVNGMQLYSYSGHKILGVHPQKDSGRLAFCKKLAEYLSSTEAQVQYHDEEGSLPARKSAQKKVSKSLSEKALLSQMNYSVPQPYIPGGYWDIAATLGRTIIDGAATLTSSELSALAKQYQNDLENCIK